MDHDTSAPALLAADQDDNRIRLFNPFAAGERKPSLWAYPAEDASGIDLLPTDAKRVEIKGVSHILAAYHGRVRLVRMHDQKLLEDLPSYSSCHSAERLPDGKIVSANSNHGMLRLHHTEEKFTDLKLPYAHGVTWDRARQCLWALGDLLYKIHYEDDSLRVEETFELPLSPTGHDLFPLREDPQLLVSNNDALFLFDITSSKFEPVSSLEGIKSASQHLDGTLWVTDPAQLEGAASWQSDSVLRVRPEQPPIKHRNPGSKFYKARWWQRVPFSY
ncbi:MAG: DUF6528 family protein [Verrucomicrobiales bacterium]